MKIVKRIILIILGIVIIGGLYGLYLYNKPPRNIAKAKEDFIISAADFYKEYEANETAANAKYLDKVIALEGMVFEIQLENEEEPTVSMATGNDESTISCGFNKKLLTEVMGLKTGDKIKIKGKCDGKAMFGIVLTQCSLIK